MSLKPQKYSKLSSKTLTIASVDAVNYIIRLSGDNSSFMRNYVGTKIYFIFANNLYWGKYYEEYTNFGTIKGYLSITENLGILGTIIATDTIYVYDTFKVTESNELVTFQDIVEEFVSGESTFTIEAQNLVKQSIIDKSKPGLLSTFDKTKLNAQSWQVKNENFVLSGDYATIANLRWDANSLNPGLNYKILLKGIGTDDIIDFDIKLHNIENSAHTSVHYIKNTNTLSATKQIKLQFTKLNCADDVDTFLKVEAKYIGPDSIPVSNFESYISIFNEDSICADNDSRIFALNNEVIGEITIDESYSQVVIYKNGTTKSLQLPTSTQMAAWDLEPNNRDTAIGALALLWSNSLGAASGVATLGSDQKLTASQIPLSLLGKVEYISTWTVSTDIVTSTGLPLPAASSSNKGQYYIVQGVDGTYGGNDYKAKDWVISNGVSWEKVDNTDPLSGSDYSRKYFIDSNKGVNDTTTGRGQVGLPYHDIQYFLSKYDDGTLQNWQTIIGSLQSDRIVYDIPGYDTDINKCYVGQNISFYWNGSEMFHPNTKITEINTVTKEIYFSPAVANGISIGSFLLWDKIEVECTGQFVITDKINRPGLTFTTSTNASLYCKSGKIIEYTNVDYKLPAQTLKGNWQISLAETGQFIKNNFTSDIGVTDAPFNFFDEWDNLYSIVAGSDIDTTAITFTTTVDNKVKIGYKYKSSICKNGKFYGNFSESGKTSLTVEQQYTYGYLGCFIGNEYNDFKNIYISKGLLQSPNGVAALNIQTNAATNNNHTYDCDVLDGDVTLSASNGIFRGNVKNAIAFTSSGQGISYTEVRPFSLYGFINATTINLSYATTYGVLFATTIKTTSTCNIYGDYTGVITDSSFSEVNVYGNSNNVGCGINNVNSSNFKIHGFFTGDPTTVGILCPTGKTIFENKVFVQDAIVNVSGTGELHISKSCFFNLCIASIQQDGGKLFIKGIIFAQNGGISLTKSAGKTIIDGGKFINGSVTVGNPIKITENTIEARTLHITDVFTNCDGITYSIMFAYDGTGLTYVPISKFAGARISEDPEME